MADILKHPLVSNVGNYIQSIQMPGVEWKMMLSWAASGCMIFGGVVPYIPQYIEIKRTNNAEGFSLFVCLTLLIANLLRILFWFGKHFELPLLAQSVVMILVMLLMIHLCTVVRTRSEIIASKPRSFKGAMDTVSEVTYTTVHQNESPRQWSHKTTFLDLDMRYFWRWTDFGSYIQFLMTFTGVMALITFLFIDAPIYVETIGFLAVFFEALLGAPQFYRNYQNKSTKGMSVKMVLCWLCGDVFKTVYFLVREAPTQFWLCGMLQVSLDIAILLQVVFYHDFRTWRKPASQ